MANASEYYANPFHKLLVEEGLDPKGPGPMATRHPSQAAPINLASNVATGGAAPGAVAPAAASGLDLGGSRTPRKEESISDILNALKPDKDTQESIQKKYDDAASMQKDSISASEEALRRYAEMPSGIDARPLLSLVDAWSGSNFAKNVKPGETPQERAANVARLQDLITKRKTDLAKTEISALKQMHTGGIKPETLLRMRDINKRTDERELNKVTSKINKETTKITDYITDSGSQVGLIKDALDSNRMGEIIPMLSQTARFVSGEKGVLTDKDIGRQLAPMLGVTEAKVISYLTSNPNVAFRTDVTAALKKLVQRRIKDISKVARRKTNARKRMWQGNRTRSWDAAMSEGGSGDNAIKALEEGIGEYEKRFGLSGGGAPAAAPKSEREQAMEWLADNPNDPMAESVRKKLGL